MALNKFIPMDCGVVSSYHKIMSLSYNNVSKMASVVVAHYSDEAGKQAGHSPIEVAPVLVFPAPTSSLVDAYTYLKTLPKYSGAQDA